MRRLHRGPTAIVLALAITSLIAGVVFAQESSPEPSAKTTADTKPSLEPTDRTDANPDSSNRTIDTSAAAGSAKSEQSMGSSVMPHDCQINQEKNLRSYEQETAKLKESLDDRLSFATGVSISSMYVQEYNQSAMDLHQKYSAMAKQENCSFPASSPVSLPDTYLPI